jgi:hypothetical protein
MPVLSLRTSGTAWRSVACRDSEKTNRRSLLRLQPDLDQAAGGSIIRIAHRRCPALVSHLILDVANVCLEWRQPVIGRIEVVARKTGSRSRTGSIRRCIGSSDLLQPAASAARTCGLTSFGTKRQSRRWSSDDVPASEPEPTIETRSPLGPSEKEEPMLLLMVLLNMVEGACDKLETGEPTVILLE